MSKKLTYKVGQIIESGNRQYAKIISIHNGRFGLSGFTNLVNAKEATVAIDFFNEYGMEANAFKIVGKASAEDTEDSDLSDTSDDTTEKPTKTSLKKLGAQAVKELAESLGIDATGTMPEVLERLYTHYEL